jgi:lipoprotein-anchoring transpeptidase ErfK/SrfK
MLQHPFHLIVSDPATDYHAEFQLPTRTLLASVRTTREVDAEAGHDRLRVEVEEARLGAWLVEVDAQLGAERLLDDAETRNRVSEALLSGEGQAEARVRHPAGTYVVQPGDNLFDIAFLHGFPVWHLEQANPDLDPNAIDVGTEITIPSIDVLLPEPIVPDKRIEISLPEQRLRAYEGEQLIFDFTCSSGMSSTPTIAGQFQVLFKEEKAFAPRWNLDMPYFMGIYQEGEGFHNGIHELPITAGGSRLWAGVLGWPASYGCIILDVGDAELLYEWAPIGTLVRISGVAPGTPSIEEVEAAAAVQQGDEVQ